MCTVALISQVDQRLHLVENRHCRLRQFRFHTVNETRNIKSGFNQVRLHAPISAKHPDPRLYIRTQYAQTSQCSECGQQHSQRKSLQGRPATRHKPYRCAFDKLNWHTLHAIRTLAEALRTARPQHDKKDTTAESTDRIWVIDWTVKQITNESFT